MKMQPKINIRQTNKMKLISFFTFFKVKLWAPRPEDGSVDPSDVPDQANAAQVNQRRMNADPLELMLLNMGYRLSTMMDHQPASSADDDTDAGHPLQSAVQCHTT